jgi:hypothetical protein
METTYQYIYDIILNEYTNNNKIFTNNFIDELLDKYENETVIYCLKTLQDININVNIDFYFPTDLQKYNFENLEELQFYNKKNRNDGMYRELVKQRFKKCIICKNGECSPEICQVAHIWEFKDCDTLPEHAYNVNNGLYMCANNHLYFDSKDNLLELKVFDKNCNDIIILVNDKLKDTNLYKNYNKTKIQLFKGNIRYLQIRYSQIEKSDYSSDSFGSN